MYVDERRGEKQDGHGHLFRTAESAERDGGDGLATYAAVLQHRPRHIRLDPPRRHAVHKNMMRGKLRGEAFHQTNYSSLWCPVMGVKRLAALAGGGRYHNDAAPSLADHLRDGVVDDGVNPLEIDRHHFVPLLLRHFLRWAGARNSKCRHSPPGCPVFQNGESRCPPIAWRPPFSRHSRARQLPCSWPPQALTKSSASRAARR